ncbi:MAG: apolipoprotein N-acyltransferase [Deltaproteobacteria bacterium RIFCSPLOWO2_01_44_7]|nr:MAG: apolipoprotein N-acyltransferase [Deltaproteobacteria bacterium RIFCSPHIGHO2_01_FULL_43_49]OGQ16372.1 MAG: apolipoprotein N-acyltransferase [Deltaproteobacteria bacterium RIFCSPHIGHO2_02_FULL_44_53]OGQ27802.1 MAG: apolipoprotein N-acyltransferase [Deltaproteobacteria bacterium RIFCSPHIGHO2_12_FULL_44_21]OGQ32890.1 MAG: apolipoprotein N-acyltransferase [Deltaproteobacteria bacterium RIFCSPLOWO2_01_FULL_45_74]OGQ37609.1 MAG: apolipoprotein N-acyltransferase [Deltaproteobacteria bacterium 
MKKYGLVALSALLVGLSFPTVLFGWHLPNLGFLAWVGLVPLCLLTYESSPRQSFSFGFLAAFLFYLLSFYWIYKALNTFGHLPPLPSVLTLLLLAVAMGLYVGVALMAARHFVIKQNGEMLIWLPIFWTLLEWARNYTPFGGFPWSNLAMSQTGYLPLIQIADVTGAYGIIFFIAWLNVWITEIILKWQGKEVRFFLPKTIVTVCLFAIVLGYGFFNLRQGGNRSLTAAHLNVGLIQPNIPQDEKWDEATKAKQKKIFEDAVQSLERNADLIIWPEASWTELLWLESTSVPPQDIGLTVTRGKRPYTLLGLNMMSAKPSGEEYFNSAALLDSDGNILDRYHKVHLVPFGEYIPLKNLLVFLKPVASVIGNFKAGKELKPLALENVKIGPLICYEDIFPELSRTLVKKGAQLLINLTNDAWYGVTSAPYQHLSYSVLRAVETRRALVRATNTGVTAIVDPTGKVLQAAPLFEQAIILHQVPLLSHQTIYTKLGDWFIWACILFVLWQLVKIYVQRN